MLKKMSVTKFGTTSNNVFTTTFKPLTGVNVAEINNLFLRRDGANNATGELDMNNHRISNLADPTEPLDSVNKRFLDNTTVSRNGDTMSGNLIFKVGNKPAITIGCNDLKDNKRFNVLLGSAYNLLQYQTRLPVIIQTSDGFTVRVGDNDVAQFTSSSINFTRAINMNGLKITGITAPVDNTDVISKGHLDNSLANVARANDAIYLKLDGSARMTGDLNMGIRKITNLLPPEQTSDGASKFYVDSSNNNPHYVKVDGSVKMTGNLDLGGKTIINVGLPKTETDAVSKKYVDLFNFHSNNDILNPKMTANTSTVNGYKYIASAFNSWDAEQPFMAFDQDFTTAWAGNDETLPNWIQIQYPFPVVITGVTISGSQNTLANRTVNGWTLQGSNDGTNFTIFYTGTGNIPGLNAGLVTYNFDNSVAYTYIRLHITSMLVNAQTPEIRSIYYHGLAPNSIKYLMTNGSIPMTADLYMNKHRVTGLLDPVTGSDALTKGYYERVKNTATANLDMGGFNIINLKEPTLSKHAVTKQYADNIITASRELIGSSKQTITSSTTEFVVRLSDAAGPTVKLVVFYQVAGTLRILKSTHIVSSSKPPFSNPEQEFVELRAETISRIMWIDPFVPDSRQVKVGLLGLNSDRMQILNWTINVYKSLA